MGSPPGVRLDHLVILVRDLLTAVDGYRRLGFTVTPGGRHADGATHNALIVFDDDTYLELVAFTNRWTLTRLRLLRRLGLLNRFVPTEPSFGCRLRRRGAEHEGLVDFALIPEDAARQIAEARVRGLTIDGPLPGGRVRPDGQQVAWQFGFPHDQRLPFLCADTTPRELRVPGGRMRTHANGALGVASVAWCVDDVAETARRYAALVGAEPDVSPDPAGRSTATVKLDTTSIVLTETGSQEAGRPCVHLRTTAGPAHSLDPTLTGGIEIDFVSDDPR